MVTEYNPAWEMVTVLLKGQNRSSTYRMIVLAPDPEGRLVKGTEG
jgi:hypothetical protein